VGADDGPDLGVASQASESQVPARTQVPATARPPIPKSQLREARFGRGQRVKHQEYGAGSVIASSVVGSEELVLVRFDSRPDKPKNLSLSIHRLEPA
jgi:hypothetical protein